MATVTFLPQDISRRGLIRIPRPTAQVRYSASLWARGAGLGQGGLRAWGVSGPRRQTGVPEGLADKVEWQEAPPPQIAWRPPPRGLGQLRGCSFLETPEPQAGGTCLFLQQAKCTERASDSQQQLWALWLPTTAAAGGAPSLSCREVAAGASVGCLPPAMGQMNWDSKDWAAGQGLSWLRPGVVVGHESQG